MVWFGIEPTAFAERWSRVGATETAFGDRSAPYMLSVDGNWVEADHAQAEISWVRETIDEAQRFSSGTYVNFGGDEPDASAPVEAAFGENLPRLRDIKQKYDPQNLFRLNNNITSG
jgi:FAD/FMN-containing dehydrogenase